MVCFWAQLIRVVKFANHFLFGALISIPFFYQVYAGNCIIISIIILSVNLYEVDLPVFRVITFSIPVSHQRSEVVAYCYCRQEWIKGYFINCIVILAQKFDRYRLAEVWFECPSIRHKHCKGEKEQIGAQREAATQNCSIFVCSSEKEIYWLCEPVLTLQKRHLLFAFFSQFCLCLIYVFGIHNSFPQK